MLIFGTRARTVPGPQIQTLCPACGRGEHRTFGLLRYVHLFWIPVFPISRKPGTECTHCRHTRIGPEVAPEIAPLLKAELFPFRRMLIYCVGFFLLLGLAGTGFSVNAEQQRQEKAWLQAPQVNDYYVIQLAALFPEKVFDNPYAILRVQQVEDDTLALTIATSSYALWTTAKKVIREGRASGTDYWSATLLRFDRATLQRMHQQSQIKAVMRR